MFIKRYIKIDFRQKYSSMLYEIRACILFLIKNCSSISIELKHIAGLVPYFIFSSKCNSYVCIYIEPK